MILSLLLASLVVRIVRRWRLKTHTVYSAVVLDQRLRVRQNWRVAEIETQAMNGGVKVQLAAAKPTLVYEVDVLDHSAPAARTELHPILQHDPSYVESAQDVVRNKIV